MNKSIISLFSGVAIGSWITYAIIKDYYTKRSNDEIATMREHYINKMLAMENKHKKEEEVQTDSEELSTKTSMDLESFRKDESTYRDYTSLYTPKPDKEEAPKVKETLSEDIFLPEEEGSEPEEDDYSDYIPTYPREGPADGLQSITPEQFNNEYPWWDKITLLYYWEDETILTESEEIMADLDIEFIRKSIGEYEQDVAYIRDESKNIDYEVHRMDGHFTDVAG